MKFYFKNAEMSTGLTRLNGPERRDSRFFVAFLSSAAVGIGGIDHLGRMHHARQMHIRQPAGRKPAGIGVNAEDSAIAAQGRDERIPNGIVISRCSSKSLQ
ncbi:hypothetical protein [Martelella sp. AD-3]|uniref:hypothetical protein n=1 Tax=Martelella sp. AD-3 TaxID=686597 RepID=UPI0004AE72D5|nr:hypothetical protein [Martelella sp. AD-3]